MSSMAFVTVLSSDGSSLEYSTYLGGSQSSAGTSIALDSQSRVFGHRLDDRPGLSHDPWRSDAVQ